MRLLEQVEESETRGITKEVRWEVVKNDAEKQISDLDEFRIVELKEHSNMA